MGRALYSTRYASAVQPAIAEPAAEENQPTLYSTWSRVSNNFDPDSEEFFMGAQYEAFVDPNSLPPVMPPLQDRSVSPAELSDISSSTSSASSEDGHLDGGVAEAEAQVDPATLMASIARSDPEWAATILRLGRAMEQRQNGPRVNANSVRNVAQPVLVLDGSTDADTSTGQNTPTFHTVPARSTPMPIPPPMVRGGGAHVAPEALMGTPQSFQMTPPSPVSVSPRLFSWGRLNTPGSPSTVRRGGGPLTSPSARVSVPVIPPARVRVHGFAV